MGGISSGTAPVKEQGQYIDPQVFNNFSKLTQQQENQKHAYLKSHPTPGFFFIPLDIGHFFFPGTRTRFGMARAEEEGSARTHLGASTLAFQFNLRKKQ